LERRRKRVLIGTRRKTKKTDKIKFWMVY
jgi:hypothetical protein